MSVPNQTPYNIYTANGLTTVFAYEFYLISASDIQVTINGSEVTSGYTVSGVGNTGGGEVTFLTAPANGATVIFERVTPTYRLTDYQDNGDLLADTVNKDFDRLWMAVQRAFIYLGVALSRPLFGGGPFNATGYRIANLADPVNDQDAATKKFVVNTTTAAVADEAAIRKAADDALRSQINSNLNRVLRVPESNVGMLPGVAARKNKLIACNSSGDPIAVLPESGSAADVLIELASNELPGLSLVALQYSGNLLHAIPEFFVDAFEADPTGATDSTDAILRAISKATGGVLVSNFSKTKTKFARVIFGSGQYIGNDIPVVSGVDFCGQGEFATAVFPSLPGVDVFRTTGTEASLSDPEKRMAGAKIRNMTIGCGLWTTDLHDRPEGAGGIYLKAGTYFLLENLRIARLNGRGLRIEGGWDSDIVNVKIVETGSGSSVSDAVPGLYVGNGVDGSVSDPSNALRFRGLQLENNAQNFHLDHDCRHITFDSPKIETSEASIRIPSIIGGVRAVSFNSAELTWQYRDQPMIRMPNDQPHFGISFNNPRPLSATTSMGWYFDHLSTQKPLLINDVDGFAVWKLVSGRNVKIQGGAVMVGGPCLIDLTSDVYIRDLNLIVSVPSSQWDGSEDAIRVNGGNVSIEGVDIYCAGNVIDGAAAIYVGPNCSNPRIKNNSFRGVKNYGIRVVSGATIAPNLLCDNAAAATYGATVYGYAIRYSVTSRGDNTGFGEGNVKSGKATIAAGASAIFDIIAGASDITIRTKGSGGVTAGKFFADYESTALNTLNVINGIKVGSGVAGDGFIYLSKTGTVLTVTNYTLYSINLCITVLSAQA